MTSQENKFTAPTVIVFILHPVFHPPERGRGEANGVQNFRAEFPVLRVYASYLDVFKSKWTISILTRALSYVHYNRSQGSGLNEDSSLWFEDVHLTPDCGVFGKFNPHPTFLTPAHKLGAYPEILCQNAGYQLSVLSDHSKKNRMCYEIPVTNPESIEGSILLLYYLDWPPRCWYLPTGTFLDNFWTKTRNTPFLMRIKERTSNPWSLNWLTRFMILRDYDCNICPFRWNLLVIN